MLLHFLLRSGFNRSLLHCRPKRSFFPLATKLTLSNSGRRDMSSHVTTPLSTEGHVNFLRTFSCYLSSPRPPTAQDLMSFDCETPFIALCAVLISSRNERPYQISPGITLMTWLTFERPCSLT